MTSPSILQDDAHMIMAFGVAFLLIFCFLTWFDEPTQKAEGYRQAGFQTLSVDPLIAYECRPNGVILLVDEGADPDTYHKVRELCRKSR